MRQNLSSTPMRIDNRYNIMYRVRRSLFRRWRLYKNAMSPCGVSKTDETTALSNVFRAISQRPSHTPNSHNRANRPRIHLRTHVNKRVYLYVYCRRVYTCTISMCNNINPEGPILDVFFFVWFCGYPRCGERVSGSLRRLLLSI